MGALCSAALIVQKLIQDTVIFAYAGGLLAFGLLLWLIARAFTGPIGRSTRRGSRTGD